MDKFLQRERNSEDMDFNDVFGGPPRRFSMQENRVRNSGGETEDCEHQRPSLCLEEKPVFGEDSVTRRSRHVSNDFFDDIFKGDESSCSPRSPNLKAMSPVRVSSQDFGTSLPPVLLSPRIKAKDFPSTLSRFSNEGARGNDEPIFNQEPSADDHHNPLFSRSFNRIKYQNPSKLSRDQKRHSEKLRRESENADALENNFHFSIYKWAGNGLPMLMPILNGNDLKFRNKTKHDKTSVSISRKTADLGGSNPEFLKKELQQVFLSEGTAKPASNVTEKGDPLAEAKDSPTSEAKLLQEWLNVLDEQPGLTRKTKEVQTRKAKSHSNAHGGQQNVKETDANAMNDAEGGAAKGKVREFVEILNQENHSRDKAGVPRRSQSNRRNPRKNKSENFMHEHYPTERGKVHLHDPVHKPDHSSKDGYKEEDNHFNSTVKAALPSEMLHQDSNISTEYDDDLSDLHFMVEVLSCDPENVAPAENLEDTKAIDAKIQQWSSGKKGNIQALLSTLQFVLWPGAGWKSVPLVDLLESNSVKRAYQKALLQLHPDKLQQKNASFHQKYTAEKVFGILQGAWDHFNTLAPL